VNKRGVSCRRRDGDVCPFHGKILERDGAGVPVEEVEREREADERRERAGTGWMAYQGDVERVGSGGGGEEAGVKERLRKRLKMLKR
jgi:hypothetical protein